MLYFTYEQPMSFLDHFRHRKTETKNGTVTHTVEISERRIKRLDHLAYERTHLANHRTLLAYWRTSFSLWLVALALFKFFEHPFYFYTAIAATVGGFYILFRGNRYYRKEKERIKNT